MGRLEAFAMANKPWPSFLDALGNAMGYAVILLLVAFVRELFGSGTLFGLKIFPESLATNGLMLYSSGACIVVGVLIWAQRALNGYREEA
jgi:Na+-transporting NADH:ubiquinone oxidoreductase subunit D